jgi:hypothetical protein
VGAGMTQHRKRIPSPVPDRVIHDGGWCQECDKRRFVTKADAKRTVRKLRLPLNAYPCGAYWHLGNLPEGVKRGVVDRRDL